MNVTDRAARVKLLLMDVDGVMTDGTLWNVPDGQGGFAETKGFDSQDGIALQWLSWNGIKTVHTHDFFHQIGAALNVRTP